MGDPWRLREPSGCFSLSENLYLELKEKRAPGRRNDLVWEGICPGLVSICNTYPPVLFWGPPLADSNARRANKEAQTLPVRTLF